MEIAPGKVRKSDEVDPIVLDERAKHANIAAYYVTRRGFWLAAATSLFGFYEYIRPQASFPSGHAGYSPLGALPSASIRIAADVEGDRAHIEGRTSGLADLPIYFHVLPGGDAAGIPPVRSGPEGGFQTYVPLGDANVGPGRAYTVQAFATESQPWSWLNIPPAEAIVSNVISVIRNERSR